MSEAFARSIVAFCRLFVGLERDAICCGTVSVSQCVVLQTLQQGEWDVSGLAAAIGVTKGAMTRLLDGLAERDLVERARSEQDGRRVLIHLTRDGRKEADRLRGLTEQAAAAILERIPPRKRRAVVESAELLREALEALRGDLPCC